MWGFCHGVGHSAERYIMEFRNQKAKVWSFAVFYSFIQSFFGQIFIGCRCGPVLHYGNI